MRGVRVEVFAHHDPGLRPRVGSLLREDARHYLEIAGPCLVKEVETVRVGPDVRAGTA